ncbi:unnamed protein product, partial [Discosporangium mesarthrocarpum]
MVDSGPGDVPSRNANMNGKKRPLAEVEEQTPQRDPKRRSFMGRVTGLVGSIAGYLTPGGGSREAGPSSACREEDPKGEDPKGDPQLGDPSRSALASAGLSTEHKDSSKAGEIGKTLHAPAQVDADKAPCPQGGTDLIKPLNNASPPPARHGKDRVNSVLRYDHVSRASVQYPARGSSPVLRSTTLGSPPWPREPSGSSQDVERARKSFKPSGDAVSGSQRPLRPADDGPSDADSGIFFSMQELKGFLSTALDGSGCPPEVLPSLLARLPPFATDLAGEELRQMQAEIAQANGAEADKGEAMKGSAANDEPEGNKGWSFPSPALPSPYASSRGGPSNILGAAASGSNRRCGRRSVGVYRDVGRGGVREDPHQYKPARRRLSDVQSLTSPDPATGLPRTPSSNRLLHPTNDYGSGVTPLGTGWLADANTYERPWKRVPGINSVTRVKIGSGLGAVNQGGAFGGPGTRRLGSLGAARGINHAEITQRIIRTLYD